MKLKINTCIILLFIIIFSTNSLKAQGVRFKIKGNVKHDSTYLQDINILNKATNLGASSNKAGYFLIDVKEGDSIVFSSLVYENRAIIISKTHTASEQITVYLEPDYYQLDEVMLNKKVLLNSINIAVTKGTILNNDEITNSKAPNARKLTDPNANAGGLNPIAILMMITKKARLKRKTKRLKLKLELEEIKRLKIEFPTTIKNLYGVNFFKETLHINEENIYLFLDYCEGNGLNEFYKSNEFIIKNFLIIQAKKFKSIKK